MQKIARRKSLLSLLLALVLALGLLPMTAFAATYTVWFESDTNRGIRAINVEEGQKLDYVYPGTKTGYAFDGWYTDESFTDQWNFDTDVVTKNMALYARWISRDSNTYRTYRDRDYYYYYDGTGYYYYEDYLYGDPYFEGDTPVYRDEIEVIGAKDQIYTGIETIKFTVYGANKSSLLAIVIFPDGDREKEIVLEKGVDYTLARKGIVVTLSDSLLQSLPDSDYDVRLYFPNNQGNARFTVDR